MARLGFCPHGVCMKREGHPGKHTELRMPKVFGALPAKKPRKPRKPANTFDRWNRED